MNQTNPANTKPNFDDLSDDALIRLKDLMAFNVIPFSSTTIWRKINARTFPEPKKISPSIVAFRCGEIREWARDPPNFVVNQSKKLNKTRRSKVMQTTLTKGKDND